MEDKMKNNELATVLKTNIQALDDWLNIWASDFCNESRVREARNRVNKVGVVAYIAEIQEQNRKTLRFLERTN